MEDISRTMKIVLPTIEDSKLQAVMEILHKLNKEDNKTIILITHDTDLIKKGTRTIRIKDGKLA